VTSHYPDRCFAFDQFGPLSIRPCHGVCRAPRKRPARLRATYHRSHGIRSNKTPAIRRWAKRENVELCFTPVNALWANPIEAQFAPAPGATQSPDRRPRNEPGAMVVA
jgi:hypothetical protein